METVDYFVATALKTIRQQRHLSLAQCAALTGVSKTMLGQIERHESGPTVATLWKISDGLQVPFSWFIQPPASTPPRPAGTASSNGIIVRTLLPYDPLLGMDSLSVTLAPGASSPLSYHSDGAIEQVIVITGTLLLTLDGEDHCLSAGDTRQFTADCQHRYSNPSTSLTLFHSLIHYPRAAAGETRKSLC